ncbi:hypothetical protein ABDK00_010125 [Niabella insulamsoli]|uniref:hypothetical protein n=1 Tax=Niabella insulamsoli TaxID=3144874 RepID=UPI0031FC75AD
MRKKLIAFLVTALFCLPVFANDRCDTSFLPEAFYHTFRESLPIHMGRLSRGYPPQIMGSAFLPEENWSSGALCYNNVWYAADAFKYDVYTDELVIQTPAKFSVVPVAYRIQSFLLANRKFVRMNTLGKLMSGPGFYELVTDGKLSLIAKRKRFLEEKVGENQVERQFLVTDEFYIKKNDQVKRVHSKKDLLSVVNDKRKLIKKVLRDEKLPFKKNRETLIIAAIEAYNKN